MRTLNLSKSQGKFDYCSDCTPWLDGLLTGVLIMAGIRKNQTKVRESSPGTVLVGVANYWFPIFDMFS